MNSTTRLLISIATMTVASLVPEMATAHPGHGAGQSFVAGVLHPLSGFDHVLMIVAVSAWAGLFRPAGRLVVAACLASFVAFGAVVPMELASGPALEAAIALTVVGSGMLLAVGRRWPLWAAGIVAALFATIHGFAHGAEGPAGSQLYVPGLALATGGLALGVSYLAALMRSDRSWLRVAGLVGAAFGATVLLG
jgi:urease accessory protein